MPPVLINHAHWGLVALSFAIGLVLTLTLMIRRVKHQVPVRILTGELGSESGAPTAKIPVAEELPTAKVPVVEELPTAKVPVVEELSTAKVPVVEELSTAKVPVVEELPTTKIPVAPYAPFGPGSARARADGSGPAGWLVKGRSDTRLYYTPDDPTYDSAVAQVWFKDEESAKRAYFTPWRTSSRK